MRPVSWALSHGRGLMGRCLFAWSSGLTQALSQRPHVAYALPQPPPRGDRLGGVPAMPVVWRAGRRRWMVGLWMVGLSGMDSGLRLDVVVLPEEQCSSVPNDTVRHRRRSARVA